MKEQRAGRQVLSSENAPHARPGAGNKLPALGLRVGLLFLREHLTPRRTGARRLAFPRNMLKSMSRGTPLCAPMLEDMRLIIRGANTAVTRQSGETLIDMADLLMCMTRRERLKIMAMIERFNEEEQWARLKPRPSRLSTVAPRDESP
jgi:hypothetical protein